VQLRQQNGSSLYQNYTGVLRFQVREKPHASAPICLAECERLQCFPDGFTAIKPGIIGWIGINNIQMIAAKDTMMYENLLLPVADNGRISTAFQRVRVNLAKVLLANNKQDKEKYAGQIKGLGDEITNLTGNLEKTSQRPRGKTFSRNSETDVTLSGTLLHVS